jgi:hypothetical protein
MSRASLMRAAKRVKASTAGGNNGMYVITTDELRVRILEECLGPNLGVIKGSATEIDAVIDRAVMCLNGELGSDLLSAQWFIRKSNHIRAEAVKLSKARKKDRDLVAFKLRDAKQYLLMANASHNLHSLAVSIRDGTPAEHRESTI